MRYFLLCTLLIWFTACSKPPPYLVAGLDLPPSATVVSRTVSQGSVTVTFDDPNDWLTTKNYFDSKLAALGFDADAHKKELITKMKAKHPDWDDKKVEEKVQWVLDVAANYTQSSNAEVAEYKQTSTGINVHLMDMQGGKAYLVGQGQATPTLGKYLLRVYK